MNLIADVNISVRIVDGLARRGHKIVRVTNLLPPTASDVQIAELASERGAAVLTRDQDFSALLAMSQAKAPSLVNLRHSQTSSDFLVELLDGVLGEHEKELEKGSIITVDDRGIRIHRLPIGSEQ